MKTVISQALFIAVFALVSTSLYSQSAWEWRNPKPQGNRLHGITYGDSQYVAVGSAGTIMTSPDGLKWRTQHSGTTSQLNNIIYAKNIYVAVGAYGTIMTSPDAKTWTRRYFRWSSWSASIPELSGISYGNNTFVAVGDRGALLSSTDGITWTTRINYDYHWYFAVDYLNGRFVTIEWITRNVWSSPDGLTWTQDGRLLPNNAGPVLSLAHDDSIAIAVGANGLIAVSDDFKNWSALQTTAKTYLRAIVCQNGRFVAVGDSGVILISDDGTSWIRRLSPTGNAMAGIACHGGRFVAVGAVGNILTSDNGMDWEVVGGGELFDIKAMTADDSLWVAVGDNGGILSSVDGLDWTAESSGTYYSLNAVAHAPGLYIAVGNAGRFAASADGRLWSSGYTGVRCSLNAVLNYKGRFYAVGDSGTLLTAHAGLEWAKLNSNTRYCLRSLSHNDSFIVAVGDSGTILYSKDGITWKKYETYWTYFDRIYKKTCWLSITYGNGVFVATGEYGYFAVFTVDDDGILGLEHGVVPNRQYYLEALHSVTFAYGLFVSVGVLHQDFYDINSSPCFISSDGRTWSEISVPTNLDLNFVMARDSMIIAAGNYGCIMASRIPANVAIEKKQPIKNHSLSFCSSNTPNPFNPATTIRFGLSQAGNVRLAVYDLRGRQVAVLADGKHNAGNHSVIWNASGVPSGVYLLKARVGELEKTERMMLTK